MRRQTRQNVVATRQKVVAGAAVAVLLAGGAVAAVSATGQSNAGTPHSAARARARDLATAAAYLGTSSAALSNELSGGKTLAQIADAAGSGKSASGLIDALETSRKARLTRVAGRLSERIRAEVNRPGGPGPISNAARLRMLFSAPRHLGEAAAAYLGSTNAALQSELSSGKTLAQIADAAAGKSKAGLIEALVAAERRTPVYERAAGAHLNGERLARRERRLTRRARRLVQRNFARPSAS